MSAFTVITLLSIMYLGIDECCSKRYKINGADNFHRFPCSQLISSKKLFDAGKRKQRWGIQKMRNTREELQRLGYCRQCLNETFEMDLKRKHCFIYMYPMKCKCCGESKRVIFKVRFPQNIILRIKMRRKNKKI